MRNVLTEKKVHDILLQRCEKLVGDIRKTWAGELDSTAISWVSRDVRGDDGKVINDAVVMEMPDDRAQWTRALTDLVSKTEAFGLLLVDRAANAVVVTFESPYGSRSWRLKKERHGDVAVLSRPTVADNVDSIGLLWSPTRGSA